MMTGEKDLDRLLKTMKPRINTGEYIFCTTKDISQIDIGEVLMIFKEPEGNTLILEKGVADTLKIEYAFVASWITLDVHSSLEAVGLTAAFSKVLTDECISCNVVTGYFHDHIFVDIKDAKKAMTVLNRFSEI